jgi:hypothetical protein
MAWSARPFLDQKYAAGVWGFPVRYLGVGRIFSELEVLVFSQPYPRGPQPRLVRSTPMTPSKGGKMQEIGSRAAGILLAASALAGVAGGVAVARVGAGTAGGESATTALDYPTRGFLVQTQTPTQTPTPQDGTGRRPCPNRQSGDNGSSPGANPSDTSI